MDVVRRQIALDADELFRSGHTYHQIANALNIPMSVVSSVLTSIGSAREQITHRRLLMNELATAGVFVEDIADTVGLTTNSVKVHLRRARIKYNIKPKEETK